MNTLVSFWDGLRLPPRLIRSDSIDFWISMVMALSTLPAESRLCAFCRWSLSELVLRPTFLLQIGHTFISGRLCCQSIDTLPCSLLSRARRALAKPSFGCARRCTFFSKFQAFARVKPLKNTALSGHSQCKTLSQSPRHLITYYLWYFADVATYLLKKEVEKIRLQVLFRLQVHIVRGNK